MSVHDSGAGQKTILLDRDGVINRDVPTSVCSAGELQFLPGSLEAIRLLKEAGYVVLVLTNQACVGRGDLSPGGLEAIHDIMRREAADLGGNIDEFFICPHVPGDQCPCRKPEPGLVFQAQSKWGFTLEETLFVGDAARDIQAALAAGCRPVLVLTGKGESTRESYQSGDIPIFADLLSVVQSIV